MALVYSCCFWFSLRLGGILIGIFSMAALVLVAFCLGYSCSQQVKNEITDWINNFDLIYAKEYLENIKEDTEKYITLGISLTCVYMVICLLFIHGAYLCNNILMIGFILLELLRLIVLSLLVTTWLLVLKQNSMDIGLLIGASVAAGFSLLGMIYLWVCIANLPILINEMERDEQTATIEKLKQQLEGKNPRTYIRGLDNMPFATDVSRKHVSTVSRNIKPFQASGSFRPYFPMRN